MTVMNNEDPAAPETTEDEAWYDAEIAPALAATVAQTLTHVLRAMAEEGSALHSPGTPEYTICRGLLAALRDIERLQRELGECSVGRESGTKAIAENLALRAALKAANDQTERFERGWYLRGHALEDIKEHCKPQPSALAAAIVATCDSGLRA